MSDFVNFKKRSVTLSKGCKDLVEMIKHPAINQDRVVVEWPTRKSKTETVGVKDVSEIGRHLYRPSGKPAAVTMFTPSENEMIHLEINEDRTAVRGVFFFPEDPELVQKGKEYLEGLGKKTSVKEVSTPDLLGPFSEVVKHEFVSCENLAGDELELESLLRRFFDEFVNLPPDSRLQCLLSRRVDDSGASEN